MSDKMLNAKSIHIFACPFKFGDEKGEIENFIVQTQSRGWTLKDMSFDGKEDSAQKRENFMRHQYFNVSARNIFFHKGEKKPCTVLDYGDVSEYTYYIKTTKNSYELEIGEIELHLYDCGVGILLIQLLNNKYTDLDAIRDINDFGRRISLPFLPASKDNQYILCAEQIGILKKGEKDIPPEERKLCVTDFRKRIKNNERLEHCAEFLYRIILHGLENAKYKDGYQAVEYYSDDRMFLMCVVRDDKLSECIARNDSSAEELLYQFIYVDNGSSTTCPNPEMRKELLDKAIYPRWSSWGTIHAVTSYSMLCITGETPEINESVIRPFVVEYSYIFSLVLAQRFCVSKFSDQAGKAVADIDEKGTIDVKKAEELAGLQEGYVAFKNKLIILQVTPQEQGVELYQLMQKQFLLHEEQEVLDEQLESLYEIINTSNGNRLNMWALGFSIVAIAVEILCSLLF